MIGFGIGLAVGALVMHGAWKLHIWRKEIETVDAPMGGEFQLGVAEEDIKAGELVTFSPSTRYVWRVK